MPYTYLKVRVGNFTDRASAEKTAKELTKKLRKKPSSSRIKSKYHHSPTRRHGGQTKLFLRKKRLKFSL